MAATPSVLRATRLALKEAGLSASSGADAGTVAVLLRLAAAIDVIDGQGLNPAGRMDNVSVPTYLKYAHELGLTPAARAAATVAGAPIEAEMGGGVRGGKLAGVIGLASQATG